MRAHRPLIAIIGAGFCGTMMAVRLLRASATIAYDVVLINRPPADGAKSTQTLARGLAYGTSSADHLLNVPAGRMSAFDDAPNDFADFLAASGRPSSGGAFVERRWYGDYLQATLKAAEAHAAKAPNGPRLTIRHATVNNIVAADNGEFVVNVATAGAAGEDIRATSVVLALGNFLPSDPPIADPQFYQSNKYLRDPWLSGALDRVDFEQPVMMIGTGLTMYDVAMSLKRRAAALGKTPTMTAISRRGLTPQAHRVSVDHTTFSDAPPDLLDRATIRHYLRSVRRHISRVEAAGGDWRDVVASLRPITPALWHRLPEIERRRFLRHVRPFWDSHRHRGAPDAAAQIAAMLNSGELTTCAARLLALEDRGSSVAVRIRLRGQSEPRTLSAGVVINCTGPSSGLRAEPLLARLEADRQIRADALGLGLDVADDYRVLGLNGEARDRLFYVGPMLKARDWEAVAVPELRGHVERAARAVVAAIAS